MLIFTFRRSGNLIWWILTAAPFIFSAVMMLPAILFVPGDDLNSNPKDSHKQTNAGQTADPDEYSEFSMLEIEQEMIPEGENLTAYQVIERP